MYKASEQLIKVYKMGLMGMFSPAQRKFEKDAANLAKDGWRVQVVTPTNFSFGYPRRITVIYIR